MSPAIWFITGASSGFGRSMAERVLQNGDIAIATLRKPEALSDLQAMYPASRLLVLNLDVTKPDEIAAAFTQAREKFGRVDVVFNNAGYTVVAEVEGTPNDVARAMFEVNFWGATNVSREAVRFFREINNPSGGKLIISSSIGGVAPCPVIGYYTATKHALEGVSKTLATELDPEWGIKITLVNYAGFATKAVSNSVNIQLHPAYTKATLVPPQRRHLLSNGSQFPGDPSKAAERIYELSKLDNPPLRLSLGETTISEFRKVIDGMKEELDKYESWSEGLDFENN